MTEELRSELGKIYDRLSKLDAQNAVISEQITSYAEGHMDIIRRHDALLYGNGVEGLKEKVNVLERIEDKRAKHIFALWSVLLSTLSAFVLKLIFQIQKGLP